MDDRAARKEFGGGVNPELESIVEGLDAETLWMVRLWRHYKGGHLWAAGGIRDQPNRYLESMEHLTGEIDRKQAAHAKRQQARSVGMKTHGAERMKRTRVV